MQPDPTPLSPPPAIPRPPAVVVDEGRGPRTPVKQAGSYFEDAGLVDPVDPNLSCGVCLSVFVRPVRTPCGHVFCAECVETWLPLKAECPECRAPVESRTVLSPDRLADRLVSNLTGFCSLRKGGCTWVGKRGELPTHLGRECPCVPIYCPTDGCGAEMRRDELAAHLETCAPPTSPVECPFGCGARVGRAALESHRAECTLEPRKLMAAISRLSLDNEALTRENARLREQSAEGLSMGLTADGCPGSPLGGRRRKRSPCLFPE